MHPLFTLEIGDQIYSGHKLIEALEKDQLSAVTEWQMPVFAFLKKWFDESNEVLVNTSGSTGSPQEIHLLKSRMRVSATMTCDYFDLQAGDRALLCLSAENIAGKMMLVRAIERGLHLIAVNPVGCPFSTISGPVKFSAMVPLQVQHCLNENCLDRTELLLIGGVAVSDTLQKALSVQTVACFSSYGMTETMSHVAIKKLNGPAASEWFEGVGDVTFGLDNRGCLNIKAERLGLDELQTNDICELDGNQRFRWLGRADFVINTGGVKVIPEQLEKFLYPVIHYPFFIAGVPDEKLGEKVVLFIAAASVDQVPVNLIYEQIRHWPKYQRPKSIYFYASFVYTASMKINRVATKLLNTFQEVVIKKQKPA